MSVSSQFQMRGILQSGRKLGGDGIPLALPLTRYTHPSSMALALFPYDYNTQQNHRSVKCTTTPFGLHLCFHLNTPLVWDFHFFCPSECIHLIFECLWAHFLILHGFRYICLYFTNSLYFSEGIREEGYE